MTANSALPRVSVVIPTHNPRMDYLARVIDALRQQTLAKDLWELVIIDNGSREALAVASSQSSGVSRKTNIVDLSWHPNARIVREEQLGLTFARLRGFAEAKGELIVLVDDDNVLAPDYLQTAMRLAQKHPKLGAFGGKCLPEFEVEPPEWLKARGKGLGLRDRGKEPQLFPEETGGGPKDQETKRPRDEERKSCQVAVGSGQGEENRRLNTDDCKPSAANRQRRAVREFPDCAPIGAGMVLRREAARAYAERLRRRSGLRVAGSESDGVSVAHAEQSPKNRITEPPKHRPPAVITDRRGDSLASGGDNDICLTVIEEGWQVGYLPQLVLTHLIPKQRMTLDYHKRMARDSMKSFILMLDQHGIRPWAAMPRWTYPLRVASDWWRVKPWQGPEESLRFWGHVGMYEGRAALAALPAAAAVDSRQ